MRALITGISGFVGAHLAAHLEQEGDDVSGVDRADGTVDILDPSSIAAALDRTTPEVVYHLAGWSDVGGSWAAPVEAFRANAEGTLNLLQACREAGVQRVLAVSSADVYGIVRADDLPIAEDSPLRPVTPYAASKVAADYLAYQAWLGYELPVIRVRAFNHVGPGQTTRFVAPAVAHQIAENERTGQREIRVGDLSPQRDFTDVRDVVRAYRLLMERGDPGEVYNVCSGRALAIRELVDQLCALSTAPMTVTVDPDLVRPVEVPILRGSAARIHAATGWAPEIPLETTLADLLADARARPGVSV